MSVNESNQSNNNNNNNSFPEKLLEEVKEGLANDLILKSGQYALFNNMKEYIESTLDYNYWANVYPEEVKNKVAELEEENINSQATLIHAGHYGQERIEELEKRNAELEKNCIDYELQEQHIKQLKQSVATYKNYVESGSYPPEIASGNVKKIAQLEKKLSILKEDIKCRDNRNDYNRKLLKIKEDRNEELEQKVAQLEQKIHINPQPPYKEWCGDKRGRPKNRNLYSVEPLTQDEIHQRIKIIKADIGVRKFDDEPDKLQELKKELKYYQDVIISSFVLGGESDLSKSGYKNRCRPVKMDFGECVKLLRSDSVADKPKVIPQLDGGGDDYLGDSSDQDDYDTDERNASEGEYDAEQAKREQDEVVVMSGKPSSIVSELFPELAKFAPLLDERVHIAFERADGLYVKTTSDGGCLDYRRELENILTQSEPYNRKDPQTILRQKFLITHTQMTGKAGFTWWWIHRMVDNNCLCASSKESSAKFLTRIKDKYPALFKCMIIYDSTYLDGKFYKRAIKKMSEAEIVLLQEQM